MELEEFEQVDAAPGIALLRLVARSASVDFAGALVLLLLDDGRQTRRLTPLPAPPDPPGQLRVGFSTSSRMVRDARRFTLQLPDGRKLALPTPRRRSAPIKRSATLRLEELLAEQAAGTAARTQAERDAVQLQHDLLTAHARAEDAQEQAAAAIRRLQTELDETRAAVASMRGQLLEAEVRSEALAEVVKLEAVKHEQQLAGQLEAISQVAELRAQQLAREEIAAALTEGCHDDAGRRR